MLKRSVKNPLFIDQIDTERLKEPLYDKDLYEKSEDSSNKEKGSLDDESEKEETKKQTTKKSKFHPKGKKSVSPV